MFDKFLTEKLRFAYRQVSALHEIPDAFGRVFESSEPKKIFAALLIVFQLIGVIVFDTPVDPHKGGVDLTEYSLVFEDEFIGDALDTQAWRIRSGSTRGGFESADQVSVKDGNLILTAEYVKDGQFGEGWYGADLALNEWYKQGYFEIRCKCNPGGGFWSAFWIQAQHPYEAQYSKGGIGGAEIDIFEANSWGKTLCENAVTQTIHCAGVGGVQEGFQSRILGFYNGNNIYDEYNTYGLMWNETEYIFYVNGVETARSTFGDGVSQVEEQVRVSLCVPSEEELSKLDKDSYSSDFVVDYVRIYQPTLTPVN